MITIGNIIIKKIQPKITEANAEFEKLGNIGWDVVGATIAANLQPILSTLMKSFELSFKFIEEKAEITGFKILDFLNPFSDMSAKIKKMEELNSNAFERSTEIIGLKFAAMYDDIVFQAQQTADAEAKISKEMSKQGVSSAEEIEKAFVRTDMTLRRVAVTAEDIDKAFEMLGATMQRVAVPEVPEGEYTQHIDFVTGMGVAFTNSGERSQEFWDNLTTGMQSSTDRTSAYVGGVSSLFTNMYSRKKQLLDNDMNAEIKAVESLAVSEESKQAKISNIKEKYRKKEIEAQRGLKPIKYAQAVSGTASAVVGALGNKPWTPFNFALAGIVAAAGAAEIATIASQPFAQGGIVPGSGNKDTVPAMLTPGEVVLNKAQQENLVGGMGGITINVGKFIGSQENADELANIIENRSRLGFNRIATHA